MKARAPIHSENIRRLFPRKGGKRIVITFHSLADLDAMGSAIALSREIGRGIIAMPDKPSSSARKLLEYSGEKAALFSELDATNEDFVVVLDSSSPSLLPQLSGITPSLLIDHHPHSPGGGGISGKKTICDPSASSTCEMLYFMLKPTDRIACISLLLGIISDSAIFKNASSNTFAAVSALLPLSGLSYSQVLALAHSPESLTERIEALRSCSSVSAERIGEHTIAVAHAKSHEGHFADMLVSLGADIAFVGCSGEEGAEGGRISARMRNSLFGRVQLDAIISEAAKVMEGHGSAHEMAGGASGRREAVKDALSVCKKLSEQQILSSEKGKIKKIEW